MREYVHAPHVSTVVNIRQCLRIPKPMKKVMKTYFRMTYYTIQQFSVLESFPSKQRASSYEVAKSRSEVISLLHSTTT